MKCRLCGGNNFKTHHIYLKPDKYEEWMGITEVQRRWDYCCKCGLYQQLRNYPLSQLEKIYEDGYRHPDLRGETIQESFDRIMGMPGSENDVRVKWLTDTIGVPDSMLDIGSGLGVFPYKMKKKGATVWCTEENSDSLGFLNNLGLHCVKGIPEYVKFELVSVVHLLEHIDDPVGFLKGLHKVLVSHGKLFVEVPDAEAFKWFNKDHDDFNSCHVCSYDMSTLYQMLKKARFDVKDIHRVFYPERKLKRIMGICQV